MSDDEGRLLIDDIQDGPGSVDNSLPTNVLVDVKSTQGETVSTSINKLSTPLTVPVFGQPQVSSNCEEIFHSGTTSGTRIETTAFSFTNNLAKAHCEQDSMFNNSIPLRQKKKPQSDNSLVLAARSENSHSVVPTSRSSLTSHEYGSIENDSISNGKRQKRYKTNGLSKSRVETSTSRKRKDGFFDGQKTLDSTVDSNDANMKRHKPLLCDRGTCVHSRAVQSEMDGSLFDLEVGSTRIVEMTVVCKMENNELYIIAKWKDQEFSGILTDGHPPAYTPYMKKRSAIANSSSNSSNGSASGDPNDRATNSGASTPSKPRQLPPTPRDPKKRISSTETKRKLSCSTMRPGSSVDPEDEEELEDEICAAVPISNVDNLKLMEVPGRKSMHVCTIDGCQHRYIKSEEIEYHKATAHAKKAVMFEARCTQTDISALRRRSVQTDVNGLLHDETLCQPTCSEETSVKLEDVPSTSVMNMKMENSRPSKSPAGYSDISDDGVAPQLQKEEPTVDMRIPLLISTNLPGSSLTGVTNALTSPNFVTSPRERESMTDSLPATPQQQKISRPSSIPVAPGTPTTVQSSFQPISGLIERNRGALNNSTGVTPVVTSVGASTPVSAIPATARVPVTPVPAGIYMPSFAHQMMPPYASQLTATPNSNPAPSPQQQLNKISQAHMKTSEEAAATSNVLPTPKNMQSPAAQNLQRQFGLQIMQSGTNQHQAAMMQAAAAQAQMAQMHHLYMQQMAAGARSGQFPMPGTSAGPHEMAQLVALQALQQQQQQNHFASIFQQK
ncbi:hypothetical protein DICVIV_07726 [Dictyocaulus viviparus]|uniref:Uncharacterized protein n=1 Tax=Dictyocaulus viviparus TaxID=29172 RepID=A0A0D8XV20_DICVI|nr:hypothetical protein DICVIV_07726 [Dictyocaulus viviparus]